MELWVCPKCQWKYKSPLDGVSEVTHKCKGQSFVKPVRLVKVEEPAEPVLEK